MGSLKSRQCKDLWCVVQMRELCSPLCTERRTDRLHHVRDRSQLLNCTRRSAASAFLHLPTSRRQDQITGYAEGRGHTACTDSADSGVHTCVHTYIQIYISSPRTSGTQPDPSIHPSSHPSIQACMHAFVYSFNHLFIHALIRSFVQSCRITYIHTYRSWSYFVAD